jgi:stage III sporulation protein AC
VAGLIFTRNVHAFAALQALKEMKINLSQRRGGAAVEFKISCQRLTKTLLPSASCLVPRAYFYPNGHAFAALQAQNWDESLTNFHPNLGKKTGANMDIDIIYKIAGVGILISVLNMVLKQAGKEEQAQMLTLAGVVIVLIMVIQLIQRLFADIRAVFGL